MDDSPLCLTLDTDWAPEEAIADAIALLDEAGAKATFFATHDSEELRKAARRRDGRSGALEIGLHPNYRGGYADPEEPLRELKELYPDAVGARSHGLCVSSDILASYVRFGMQYEANIFLVGHEGLRPVARNGDLWSIPCYWSDDNPLCMRPPFRLKDMRLDSPGLKVVNFHPIHIYMNTYASSHYAAYKPYMKTLDRLAEHVNTTRRGVRSLFLEVLNHVAAEGRTTYTLNEVYSHHAAPSGPSSLAAA